MKMKILKLLIISKVKNDLVKKFGLNSKKIKVIYNPFDLDLIRKQSLVPIKETEFVWNNKRKSIIYVGRIDEHQKAVSVILKSVALIANQKEYINLLIVGDGQERENMRDLSKRLGIGKQVFFLGWKENPYSFIRKSDALILSSVYEGFGNVLVEAMACGTPVISTNCQSGPSEILEGGKYGTLVPVNDIKKFSEAILATLKNYADSELLRKRAEYFSAERTASQYLEVFEDILN